MGVAIMIGSVTLYAAIYPLLKKTNEQLPPFTVMAISMFVLFMISFLGSIIFENGFNIKISLIKSNLTFLVLAGTINFVAFWLAILGFRYFAVWQQNMFLLLSPIISGIFAYMILGEGISIKLFIGLLIMGAGLFIAVR